MLLTLSDPQEQATNPYAYADVIEELSIFHSLPGNPAGGEFLGRAEAAYTDLVKGESAGALAIISSWHKMSQEEVGDWLPGTNELQQYVSLQDIQETQKKDRQKANQLRYIRLCNLVRVLRQYEHASS